MMEHFYKKYLPVLLLAIIKGSSLFYTYAQDVIYVTKSGSPDPDGSIGKPYHVIKSAISKSISSGAEKIIIGPGKYYEKLTITTSCNLSASRGKAIIGKLDYQAVTPLNIISLNTHLAGDEVFFPSWQDYNRADDIADYIKGMNPNPDVVCFQEIWDEDLFKGGDGANGIKPRSGFNYGKHGEREGAILNSGLAIMSDFWLAGFSQIEFDACDGIECHAAKGWIQTTINKNGFGIGLFTLHTQAGNRNWWIRFLQLNQLISAINEYRLVHPDNVLFVTGDFNIYGRSAEYGILIDYIIKNAGGYDADHNSPDFISGNFNTFTLCDCNPLAMYFDDETKSGRLDYIFYFPSKNGSCEILPVDTEVIQFKGRLLSEDGLSTRQSSDHWAAYGQFKLIRK